LNGETSNNSARLVAATLIVNIARLAATALAIPIIAAPPKPIATILRRSTCKATGGCAASGAS
jgi:hypothetical protein